MAEANSAVTNEKSSLVGSPKEIPRSGKSSLIRLILIATLLALIAGAAFWWYRQQDGRQAESWRTVAVKRGDLVATISATGTVVPEEVIDVGAQVAGKIVAFGKDRNGKTIDYGSAVEEGTILAQIDAALYSADAAQARAQVQQARAGLERAQADLGQLQARLFQTERDWNRTRKLGPSEALSQSDFDAAQSAYEIAKANLAVGRAAIDQAKEAVSQAEAQLRRAEQNLEYCVIKSPVKGVIIDRRVNIGQTVVASLNAPSLFLIAKDLKRLQVWVAVNEADVGNIHPGQAVTFTVDAFPGQVFQGEVGKLRLNATMTQNVVTYTVEVNTDNSSGKLLPYLTANVKFLVSERHDVLLVPNAALRWIPPGSVASADRTATAIQRPGAQAGAAAEPSRPEPGRGTVWGPEGTAIKPIPVQVGMSDGTFTEVKSEALKEGTPVIVGEQQAAAASTGYTSPFAPQLGRGGTGPRR
ncbi:MAG TPA: efflux RND transporter periplasmic adaptor subunit [Candidatus Competibacteraceae bacterium]|nr:efflux RND transporter periplasmic adaptor subunit [Candidatus Competibacteraceae bacterium]